MFLLHLTLVFSPKPGLSPSIIPILFQTLNAVIFKFHPISNLYSRTTPFLDISSTCAFPSIIFLYSSIFCEVLYFCFVVPLLGSASNPVISSHGIFSIRCVGLPRLPRLIHFQAYFHTANSCKPYSKLNLWNEVHEQLIGSRWITELGKCPPVRHETVTKRIWR